MKSRAYLLVAVLLLAFLIGYRLVQKRIDFSTRSRQRVARMKVPPTVSLGLARIQDIAQSVDSVGSVEAPLSVNIAAKLTGRIVYLAAREGDRVVKGQVLVRIDPSQVEAQVRQARAAPAEEQYRLAQARITQNPTDVSVATQVRQQEAAVRSAEANLANATARYKRAKDLYEKGFISAQDADDAKAAVGVQQAALDEARAALDYARANTAQKPAYEQSLAALQASVAAAEAGVKSAEALRADALLAAPFDGFVTGRYLDPGAVVTPGMPILAVQYMREVWEAVELLKEVAAGALTIQKLKRVKPARQVEIVEMMLLVNNFSSLYCEALVAATPKALLADNGKARKHPKIGAEDIARMEREMEALHRDLQAHEDSYGQNFLNLVVVRGYLSRLLDNDRVVRFCSQECPDVLEAFQQIVASTSLEG